MTLQDEETPIDMELVNEVVALIPETWEHAILEVEYSVDDRGEVFDHMIYNPDGQKDLVEISDVIYDATFRLQQLFHKHGGRWNRVRYDITVVDDGIQYKARFDTRQ